jgi:hypothetical protein
MASAATYDDVNLIIKIYELRREPKLREARDWFNTQFRAKTLKEFMERYPPGSEGNANIRMVMSYWDMVASFITSGVLNEDLFFQSGGEMLSCWEKIRGVNQEFRELMKNPLIGKNLEEIAARYVAWYNRKAPGAYDAMLAMMESEMNAPRA